MLQVYNLILHVKHITSPYNPSPATELVNNQWYSLCAGGPIAQYNTSSSTLEKSKINLLVNKINRKN